MRNSRFGKNGFCRIGFANFFVVCVAALCMATAVASDAQTYNKLRTFVGRNGAGPEAPLVQGIDGNFYGTTAEGGAIGSGTVFKITPEGKLTTLWDFCSQASCKDGAGPAGLMLGADGNFYGVTALGGSGSTSPLCGNLSCGTIFKITPEGKLTTLYDFCSVVNSNGSCLDGMFPEQLLIGPNGNLYGVTARGGSGYNENCGGFYSDCGTIFEITSKGKLTTLYNFCLITGQGGVCPDGNDPNGLVVGADGNLYGTTPDGGANVTAECQIGCGTIYKITPKGAYTQLYSFCLDINNPSCQSGASPQAPMIAGPGMNFSGTTYSGGNVDGSGGTVFHYDSEGLTTVYRFCTQIDCKDGDGPGFLVYGSDGNYYGTTVHGGTNTSTSQDCLSSTCGVVFEVTWIGEEATLYDFCSASNCSDGSLPQSGVVQGTDGNFYGTASQGGDSSCLGLYEYPGCGTVFSVSTGLRPFVEANPNFGKAGSVIGILGNNLTGTTSVTFSGVAATFNVASDTYITATVPSGAMLGGIEVTTPHKKLESNVDFSILP
jgi:uncharacterized repeat protein (TIGR03803 family)